MEGSSALRSVNSSLQDTEMEVEPTGFLGKARSAWGAIARGTVFSSIFILLTTCIGAGTLSLPYGFAQGGLIFSSMVFFIIMVISIHVGSMLLGAKRYALEVNPKAEIWGYEDLAVASFGIIGKIIVLLTIAILLFLALIAYMIYTRDQLYSVVDFALTKSGFETPCSPLVNCAVIMCIAFLPIFPLTLLRNLSPLQFTSLFSVLCVACVAFLTMEETIRAWVNNGKNSTEPLKLDVKYVPSNFNGALTVISYCSLSFICHFNLLPLEKELRPPVTKLKLYTVLIGAMLTAYTLYNLVIFAGYFRFFNNLSEDVMLNYAKDDIPITVARIALFFTLLFHYPVLLHPTRGAINGVIILSYGAIKNDWWKRRQYGKAVQSEERRLLPSSVERKADASKQTEVPTLIWFSETWIIFATTFLAASYVPNVGIIWNFVGSIGGVLVFYIYPPAFYLRLRYMRYRKRMQVDGSSFRSQYDIFKEAVAFIILIIGVVLFFVENYQSIVAVIKKTHGPIGQCYQLQCSAGAANSSIATLI